MLPLLRPRENQLGRDVSGAVPTAADVPGLVDLPERYAEIWRLALPYLGTRDNDGHSIYSYGLAHALVRLEPEVDPDVVLPAILLHDTGWSQVPDAEVLDAIAPGGGRPDLVLRHEEEGVRIAGEVLAAVGHDPARTERILAIIDGHDSRREARSLEDALMKDADKLWRLTPHGVDTVMDWFGLDRAQASRLIASRVHPHLLTDAGRTMALALGAVLCVDTFEERVALG